MKHILILYDHRSEKCVTGGQFYEENMYQVMKEYPNLEVRRYIINRGRSFITKLLSPLLNIKFYSLCKNFNLIIFNSVEAWYFIPLVILLRLSSGTKIAIIHHHFIYLEFRGIKRIYYKYLESAFLRLSNYIITVSPYIHKLCRDKFINKNIRIWPIPFSDEINEDNNPNKKDGNLIYIGSIEPRKGLIYLIKALSILENIDVNVHLNIIGKVTDKNYYKNLQNIIEEHKLDVKFHGFVDNEKKDHLLHEANIFVFPSLLEGYGMVIREVMAYGLPIVCFNNSAMPYIVKNNVNGLLVENKNEEKLAEAIKSIITNSDLRMKLSQGSYQMTKATITPEKYKEYLYSDLCMIFS